MGFIRNMTCRRRATVLMPTIRKFIVKGDKVLDVGCDTGTMSLEVKRGTGCLLDCTDFTNVLKHPLPFIDKPEMGKYDKVLLIDVLHHIIESEQVNVVKYWERFGKVIIIDTEPTMTAYLVDLFNEVGGMPTPYTFRTLEGWELALPDYKIEKVKTSRLYPLKHLIMVQK